MDGRKIQQLELSPSIALLQNEVPFFKPADCLQFVTIIAVVQGRCVAQLGEKPASLSFKQLSRPPTGGKGANFQVGKCIIVGSGRSSPELQEERLLQPLLKRRTPTGRQPARPPRSLRASPATGLFHSGPREKEGNSELRPAPGPR